MLSVYMRTMTIIANHWLLSGFVLSVTQIVMWN